MTKVYEQHRAAFGNVSAYIITLDVADMDHLCASIAFKYPKDGMGRLYAYVHLQGYTMLRGFAAGMGYDKRSAALASIARKVTVYMDPGEDPETLKYVCDFWDALALDDGRAWEDNLRRAGFKVYQAV